MIRRLLLATWLAVFALQSADVVALLLPDGCFELAEGGDEDDRCPDEGCARCLCGARIPAPFVSTATFAIEPPAAVAPPAFLEPSTSVSPRGILHVPKAL